MTRLIESTNPYCLVYTSFFKTFSSRWRQLDSQNNMEAQWQTSILCENLDTAWSLIILCKIVAILESLNTLSYPRVGVLKILLDEWPRFNLEQGPSYKAGHVKRHGTQPLNGVSAFDQQRIIELSLISHEVLESNLPSHNIVITCWCKRKRLKTGWHRVITWNICHGNVYRKLVSKYTRKRFRISLWTRTFIKNKK